MEEATNHLDFAPSQRSTVGVEWELQLVDMDSNDLRQAANTVIKQAWQVPELKPLVHREMLLNTVEIASGAHTKVSDCMRDLRFAVTSLRPKTNELRADFAAAGSHPFAQPAYQRVTDSRRYAELVQRTQYWGRQMLLYGVHVHVGVESREKVLPIINTLLTYGGRLQSLAASSPYWAGQDTGYASNRAMVFQQLPTSGIPRQFTHWEELERYAADMKKAGVISTFDEVRWDIRPSPHLGTVEIRIFDACSNIREVEACASLAHALVDYCSSLVDAGEELPRLPDWFIEENKWRSARYGLDAQLITNASGQTEHVRDSLANLVEQLRPTARELGCEPGLELALEILEKGGSYTRQRAVAAAVPESPLDAVVSLLRAEMQEDRPLTAEEFLDTHWADAARGGTR
ncbi:glutamate--cysteine ligase [Scrofimicrobium sp. R131]|uniref:Putative glutamate--cysteine ligase 2 n=1 Tax=Scrofimicrobium appendicitidis TaxID=3079930 RepID=A0AAU7V713_9ACTO